MLGTVDTIPPTPVLYMVYTVCTCVYSLSHNHTQVLAYTLGLGTLVRDEDRLRKHMMAELLYNDSPYGMLVMTGGSTLQVM